MMCLEERAVIRRDEKDAKTLTARHWLAGAR